MKKIAAIFLIAGLLLLACGGGEDTASQPDETDSQAVTEGQDTAVEETPIETAPPPLYPEGTLDPSQITADTPVSVVALFESYFVWDGKKVTLEGYPRIPYIDTMIVEDELELVAEPGDREALATISFTDYPGITVRSDQLVTVSGTIEYYWTGDIQLVDGVIIEDAPPAQSGIVTSPYVYDGDTPILAGEFFDMFNVWSGREIIVDGNYHSTTTSTTSYGVTVRVDLSDPNDTYSKYVACEMLEEIPEGTDSLMVANREGTQIRGTVEGESFSMVGLVNCQLVNR
ncbi:MAG: hypothetical protein KAR44_06120 [Candidatus Aegiribacteria sp.]|nr:hypothetical protein [Candidatus Aegiribacteria sp.]